MCLLHMVNEISDLPRQQSLPYLPGGYPKFVSQGLNKNYLPVWLQQAGYNTYYTGKLFNAHTIYNYFDPYPAGFTGTVTYRCFAPTLSTANYGRNSYLTRIPMII